MYRVVYVFALAIILSPPALSSGQSLVEVAKKEKERRAKNHRSGEVRVVEEEELKNAKGAGFSITGETATSASSDMTDPSGSRAGATAEKTPSRSSKRASSTDGLGDKRRKCEEDLRAAETERKQLQTLFDQGAADGAGASVSCGDVLSSPSQYPAQATRCADIKRRIEAAEERMRQALDCMGAN